jgi:hypothetical protein
MTLPNFFIVGTVKGGTTSLYFYLRQHPQVFMPDVKEPAYFRSFKPDVDSLAAYKKLFEGAAGEKAIGEASTAYLYAEESPALIKAAVPDAKIIISLRNPAEMAYSLWRYISRIGKRGEHLPFEAALEAEDQRMKDPEFQKRETWPSQFYYFHRGLYHDQVKRYIDTFGRGNVKILIFEEFVKDPLKICREVFEFLGVDPDFRPNLKKKNAGNIRHRGLNKLLTEPTGRQARVMAAIPSSIMGPVRDYLMDWNSKPAKPMDKKLRRELLDRYAPDIKRLEELIQRDLSHWMKDR